MQEMNTEIVKDSGPAPVDERCAWCDVQLGEVDADLPVQTEDDLWHCSSSCFGEHLQVYLDMHR